MPRLVGSESGCESTDCCFSEHYKFQLFVLFQYKAGIIIISTKFNLFSTWYTDRWKTVHFMLDNNHSLYWYSTLLVDWQKPVGFRGRRDRMAVGFMQSVPITTLWVRTPLRGAVLDTTLLVCDKVCQWLVAGWWFSPVSSTNKTDCYNITEILLKVALNTITLTPVEFTRYILEWFFKHNTRNLQRIHNFYPLLF